jgi:hypothetical protein
MTANRFGCETKTNKQQMYCYIVVNYFNSNRLYGRTDFAIGLIGVQ